MAEWWEDLAGGKVGKFDFSRYDSKAGLAGDVVKSLGHATPGVAKVFDSIPGGVTDSWVTSLVDSNGANWNQVLQGMATSGVYVGIGAAASLLSKPSSAPNIEPSPEYSVGPGLGPVDRQEKITNEGYPGFTRVLLGPLEFEVPPAMSSVVSVHGAMGNVAPGAGPGITIRHVQNFSTMLIPGSVPLYQSLGIQGQMLEFVGAFLGFDHKFKFDGHKHFVGPTANEARQGINPTSAESEVLKRNNLTAGESQVYSDLSPDPFYLPNSAQAKQINARGYLGYQYGLSAEPTNKGGTPTYGMGNLGAWAVSRAFEMQIRRGVPLLFVINTGIVTIKYDVVVVGFDRLYQRDDRTWYKIQGMIVGSTEVKKKRKNTGRGKIARKDPNGSRNADTSRDSTLSNSQGGTDGYDGSNTAQTGGGTRQGAAAQDAAERTQAADDAAKLKNFEAQAAGAVTDFNSAADLIRANAGVYLVDRGRTPTQDNYNKLDGRRTKAHADFNRVMVQITQGAATSLKTKVAAIVEGAKKDIQQRSNALDADLQKVKAKTGSGTTTSAPKLTEAEVLEIRNKLQRTAIGVLTAYINLSGKLKEVGKELKRTPNPSRRVSMIRGADITLAELNDRWNKQVIPQLAEYKEARNQIQVFDTETLPKAATLEQNLTQTKQDRYKDIQDILSKPPYAPTQP